MLTRSEYLEVARIHCLGIDAGFLSTLGDKFLALLYEAIDRSADGVLLVARSNGRVVGFVAGARGLGEIYACMLRSPMRLFLSLFPNFFSPRKLFRIVETVAFSRKSKVDEYDLRLPSNELLSISVLEEFRGQGIADRLFGDLVCYFKARGVDQFKIVVGDALLPAHKFYRRMGACPVARAEVHSGSGSVIYVRDVK